MKTIKRRMLNTLNGGLNKLLIDGYVVIREADGHVLSDNEIMALTRQFFNVTELEINEIPKKGL